MTKRGVIKFKRTISHIETHLADEIGKKARVFFNQVYTLPKVDEKRLLDEEKAFWKRYEKLAIVHTRAKNDQALLQQTAFILNKKLPFSVCTEIMRYVQ